MFHFKSILKEKGEKSFIYRPLYSSVYRIW